MSDMWRVDEQKTKEHWLELVDPEGWYHAVVMWDGCIQFDRYFNVPIREGRDDEDADSLHICDLDDMIARLQALKAEALKHFSEGWPA